MLLWVIQPVIVDQLVHERASVTLQPVIRDLEIVRLELSSNLSTRSGVVRAGMTSGEMMESDEEFEAPRRPLIPPMMNVNDPLVRYKVRHALSYRPHTTPIKSAMGWVDCEIYCTADTEQGNVPALRSKELADEIDRGNLQHREEDGTYIPTITLSEVLEVRRIEVLRGAKRRDPPTVRDRSEDFLCLDSDDPMQRRRKPAIPSTGRPDSRRNWRIPRLTGDEIVLPQRIRFYEAPLVLGYHSLIIQAPLDLKPVFGHVREVFRLLPKLAATVDEYFPDRKLGDAMRITTLVMGKEAHIWLAFVREREQELASYRDYECALDIIAKDVFMIGRPIVMVTRLPHDDDFTTWETTVEIYHRWTDQSQTVVLLTGSLGTPTPWLRVPSNYVSRDRPICLRECRRECYWPYQQIPEGEHRVKLYRKDPVTTQKASQDRPRAGAPHPENMGFCFPTTSGLVRKGVAVRRPPPY